jgi:hypothetical protein
MRCDGEPVRPGMRTTRRMSRASQPADQNGTLSADTIRASGHVRPHQQRPDTRLHPTKTQKTSSQPLREPSNKDIRAHRLDGPIHSGRASIVASDVRLAVMVGHLGRTCSPKLALTMIFSHMTYCERYAWVPTFISTRLPTQAFHNLESDRRRRYCARRGWWGR